MDFDDKVLINQLIKDLKIYSLKLVIFFLLSYIFLIFSIDYIQQKLVNNSISTIEQKIRGQLKVGKDFWAPLESEIYKLADQPDIPIEQKEKIILSLKKINSKYSDYFEALLQREK